MKPVKNQIQNQVWVQVQDQVWDQVQVEVRSQVSRGMTETVNLIWIWTSSHTQDKVQ